MKQTRLPAALAFALAIALSPSAAPAADAPPPKPFNAQRAETQHEIRLAGSPLAYTAIAEFLPLVDDGKSEPAARVHVVSYLAQGAEIGRRPVMFLFNGGPGAASAYLHMGAAGPRAIRFSPDGSAPPPPVRLEDNPDTWLAFADLVFIDPVGTGFSRAQGDEKAAQRFYDVKGDLTALVRVMQGWLTANRRWSSPVFLAGESYGGFRAAQLVRDLIGAGVGVSGAVLVSPVIDFGTLDDDDTAILAAAFRLPSVAASAAALGKAKGTPAEAAAEAERYALGDYITGLARLDTGDLAASRALFSRTAELTGLPETLVERMRGRIHPSVFAREILRDQGAVVSKYDGSEAADDAAPGWPRVESDPLLEGSKPAYVTAFLSYLQDELKAAPDGEFRLLSNEVNRAWEWPRGGMPNAGFAVQEALSLNPALRILIAHGRTDLVTPYFGSVWIARQTEMARGRRDRLAVAVYDGGHMMYARASERARLAADVGALVKAATR